MRSHPMIFSFINQYIIKRLQLLLLFLGFIICRVEAEGAYIERFSTTDNGGITFTGNSIGLGKATGENNPGTNDSIGTFITTNQNLQVNHYPPGTTLLIEENSSAAVLDLPSGSNVLYAELIWSGSYGWPLDNPLSPPPPDCQITLTTPQSITHVIKADPSTAQDDLTPGFSASGNYVRSANVTSFVQLGGRGTYTVGQIPGTVDPSDEEHNAAGWTLAVVYRNPKMYTSKMSLWVGCEQGKESKAVHIMKDFCTPPFDVKTGRLFISAIEGDAVRTGDHLLFGFEPALTFPKDALNGTNNVIDNFFSSQINTVIEMERDKYGKLIQVGHGQLDLRGTFGTCNQDAINQHNVEGARQGYDITSIDLADKIDYSQREAYIQGQTLEGDEDYTIGALGLQIQVDAPIIKATKRVDGLEAIPLPSEGQTLHISLMIENVGSSKAKKVLVRNLLQTGLIFVPGSFKLNGDPMPDRYIDLVPIGDLQTDIPLEIEFQAIVDALLLNGKPKIKSTKIDYQCFLSEQDEATHLTSSTNSLIMTR